MTSCRLRLFVISEYTLILMFPCGHMLWRQSWVASLFYVIIAVYVVLSQNQSCRSVPSKTAVSLQRCLSFDLHVTLVRSRDTASTRARLSAFSREDRLQASSAGLQAPQWCGTVIIHYPACEFHCVADEESRQQLRSASTADLIVPRVRCGRWSRSSSRGCACIEHSSIKRDVTVAFGCQQIPLENRVVQAMLYGAD